MGQIRSSELRTILALGTYSMGACRAIFRAAVIGRVWSRPFPCHICIFDRRVERIYFVLAGMTSDTPNLCET
jgi:hypothetical protein